MSTSRSFQCMTSILKYSVCFYEPRPSEANGHWGGGGVWRQAPSNNFKIYKLRNTISMQRLVGSDILPKSALQIISLGTSRSGLN